MDATVSPGGTGRSIVIRSLHCSNSGLKEMILVFVGQATAIGQALDVPIFIRSVAQSLIFVDDPQLPLPFEDNLLATLDNGIDPDSPAALVAEYACDWWNNEDEPGEDGLLNRHNLQQALLRHQAQHPYTAVQTIPTFPALDPSVGSSDCPKCPLYRNLASDTLAELQGILEFADANEISAQNHWEMDMRRAQGLYALHEAVLHKEMNMPDDTPSMVAVIPASASASAPAPLKINSVPVNRKSRRVMNQAMTELQRLQQQPSGSHRWTWGPVLTPAEVRELVPPPGRKRRHTGYRLSLPDGGFRGQGSSTPTLPLSDRSADYTDVSPEVWDNHSMPEGLQSVDRIAISNDDVPTRQHFHTGHRVAEADRSPTPPKHVEPSNSSSIPDMKYADEAAELWDDNESQSGEAPHDIPEQLNVDAGGAAAAWGDEYDADADDDMPDADAPPADGGVNTSGVIEVNLGVNAEIACGAWGEDSDADADPAGSHGADGADADAHSIGSAGSDADAERAGQAWGDDSNSDADPGEYKLHPTAHDAQQEWESDSDESLGNADAAAEAWSSSSMGHDSDEIPLVISPSRITLPHVYSASDFGFVDDSWFLNADVNEEESDEDDEDNQF
jgi:hypothetical protein